MTGAEWTLAEGSVFSREDSRMGVAERSSGSVGAVQGPAHGSVVCMGLGWLERLECLGVFKLW